MHPLLKKANKLALSKASLLRFADELPNDEGEFDALMAEAVNERREGIFSRLIFAAYLSGRKIAAQHFDVGFSLLVDSGEIAVAMACAEGDIYHSLMTNLREHGGAPGHRVLLLWHAAKLLKEQGEPFQGDIAQEARYLFRERAGMLEMPLLWDLCDILGDKELVRLIEQRYPPSIAESKGHREFVDMQTKVDLDRFEKMLERQPDQKVLTGFTMRRSVEKVGRNERCPCGSGKKYKKCCMKTDQEKLADSSHLAGVTQDELLDNPEAYLDRKAILKMTPTELSGLDPQKIPEDLLPMVVNNLLYGKEHEAVTQLFESVGISDTIKGHAVDVVDLLLSSKKYDLFERMMALDGMEFDDDDRDWLGIKLAHATAKPEDVGLLAGLETKARELLDGDTPSKLMDSSFDLLESRICPALGILVARGLLPLIEDWEERQILTKRLLKTRDSLGFSPFDPIEKSLNHMEYGEHSLEYSQEKHDRSNELFNQIKEKDESLQKSQVELSRLSEQLAKKQKRLDEELEKAKRLQIHPNAPKIELPGTAPLKGEIKALQEDLKTQHNERNALKRDLETARQKITELKTKANEASDETKPNEQEDAKLFQNAEFGDQPSRIPGYSPSFRSALSHIPAEIASKAILLSGDLGSGRKGAFQGIKRLKQNRDIYRARIGGYRIFFTLSTGDIEFLDIFHRRELERKIKAL